MLGANAKSQTEMRSPRVGIAGPPALRPARSRLRIQTSLRPCYMRPLWQAHSSIYLPLSPSPSPSRVFRFCSDFSFFYLLSSWSPPPPPSSLSFDSSCSILRRVRGGRYGRTSRCRRRPPISALTEDVPLPLPLLPFLPSSLRFFLVG